MAIKQGMQWKIFDLLLCMEEAVLSTLLMTT